MPAVTFLAEGRGSAIAAATLDGVYLLDFEAEGVGSAEMLAAARYAPPFEAEGVGATQIFPSVGYVPAFVSLGVGSAIWVQQIGFDELNSIGPDLANMDPLLIGVVFLGDVDLLPPEDLEP